MLLIARNNRFARKSRSALVALVAGTLCMATAACGSDSSEPESSGELGTLTVVSAVTQGSPFVAVMEGNEFGVWDDVEGLTVETVEGDHDGAAAAMAAGKADISLVSGDDAIRQASVGNGVITGCIMGPWAQYLLASKQSGVTDPSDLRGKTFGVSNFGVAGDYATRTLAAALGFDDDDYKVTALGDVKGLSAALESGSIDAFVWSAATAYSLAHQGIGTMLGSVAEYVGETCFEAFLVRKEVIEERPEALKAFFTAYYDAIPGLRQDPDSVTRVFVDKWGIPADVAPDVTKDTLRDLSDDGEISPEALQKISEAAQFTDDSLTEDKIDLDAFYTYWKDL